jgi:hypothetical protein
VTNPYIRGLSKRPASKAISWNMYFVNGYKFHTQAWSNGKKTTNCGIHVRLHYFTVNGLTQQRIAGHGFIPNTILLTLK